MLGGQGVAFAWENHHRQNYMQYQFWPKFYGHNECLCNFKLETLQIYCDPGQIQQLNKKLWKISQAETEIENLLTGK